MISVLIVDDYRIVRGVLKHLLSSYPEINVIGEVESGRSAIDFVNQVDVDIILMDISMPDIDGITATKIISEKTKKTKIIMLTMRDDIKSIRQSFDAGASGFLSKDSKSDNLIEAINKVYEGEVYLSQDIIKTVVEDMRKSVTPEKITIKNIEKYRPEDIFSDRELDILHLICLEYTTQEIADKLELSKRTVEIQRNQMLEKIGVNNIIGLVLFAMKSGYVKRRKKSKSPKDANSGEKVS